MNHRCMVSTRLMQLSLLTSIGGFLGFGPGTFFDVYMATKLLIITMAKKSLGFSKVLGVMVFW